MSISDSRPVLVLGGDGYLGWPLSLSLARRNPSRHIIIADNFLRRRLVSEVGGCSLLPILNPNQRLEAIRRIYQLENVHFIYMDVNSGYLESLIEKYQIAAVYHLAQQCSAPYSMRGSEEALFTLRNNEEANMRLLWAVKEYVPDCHIIKLGSFGEYAISGLDVAEGYFTPTYKGRKSKRPIPYPREADDFYHVSKINDTNNISVACRKWGLRITDVMQSTVFGSWTADIANHEELSTRLDYDEYFGTVVNRFLAQAISGKPLTVYGSGNQRTGLMSLQDSVESLSSMLEEVPAAGTHRVINNLTEISFSINELSRIIAELMSQEGFMVEVQRGEYDPRFENADHKLDYRIEHNYVAEHIRPESMKYVVSHTLQMLLPYKSSINTNLFMPHTVWNDRDFVRATGKDLVMPTENQPSVEENVAEFDAEKIWDNFRIEHFPYQHINLNAGTFGSISMDALNAMRDFQTDEILAQPLQQYVMGREAMMSVLSLAEKTWPSKAHNLHVTESATRCSNLLALNFARQANRTGCKLRVLTTPHEHIGGLGAFEKMPEFEVCYLSEQELDDYEAYENLILDSKPDICMLSHVAYDTGSVYPIEVWGDLLKQHMPECWFVIDVSQSLGLLELPFNQADVLFGSCHKWLFGPRGMGLLWTNEAFRQTVGALNWAGDSISEKDMHVGFAPAGGMDFSLFAGLDATIKLYLESGSGKVSRRSSELSAYFAENLSALMQSYSINHQFLDIKSGMQGETGTLTLSFPEFDPYPLYKSLIKRKIHTKCIKKTDMNGHQKQLLRLGIPYYETRTRLDEALNHISDSLTTIDKSQPLNDYMANTG